MDHRFRAGLQPKFGDTLDPLFKGDAKFSSRQVRSDTTVLTHAKGNISRVLPRKVDQVRIVIFSLVA
jgi:hypothetical protein